MPRNVRNFWLTLNVDGKKTPVATGPRSKDGGFELEILMRNAGDVDPRPIVVTGRADPNGQLVLTVKTDCSVGISEDRRYVGLMVTNRD